ncbi:hypothetical protein MKW98_014883 [Papaver atlanticum]|uniref:Uncharacterized protein n=1 Tax=Papaver atlanticum TaxID=357466 RepID=A0AAD4SFM9_9MAGN|nr:hypothetical protein MKW98_014883 [Papaver atlanticum]
MDGMNAAARDYNLFGWKASKSSALLGWLAGCKSDFRDTVGEIITSYKCWSQFIADDDGDDWQSMDPLLNRLEGSPTFRLRLGLSLKMSATSLKMLPVVAMEPTLNL